MLTFLFWNINGKPLEASVRRLVKLHSVDVLILAESGVEPARMVAALNADGEGAYTYPFSEGKCERLQLYNRESSGVVLPLYEGSDFSARRLRPPTGDEVLLIAAHLPSKLHQSEGSQQQMCNCFAQDVTEMEGMVSHERTVIVGDLNVDPFEKGVVGAGGLHAVSSGQVARQGTREVRGRQHTFLYNPMWALLGDRDASPPGTYDSRRAEHVWYFWHAFDQVLLRPALIDSFVPASLSVLASDGEESLLRRNRSGVEVPHPSDHLPVLFALRLEEEDDDAPSR